MKSVTDGVCGSGCLEMVDRTESEAMEISTQSGVARCEYPKILETCTDHAVCSIGHSSTNQRIHSRRNYRRLGSERTLIPICDSDSAENMNPVTYRIPTNGRQARNRHLIVWNRGIVEGKFEISANPVSKRGTETDAAAADCIGFSSAETNEKVVASQGRLKRGRENDDEKGQSGYEFGEHRFGVLTR